MAGSKRMSAEEKRQVVLGIYHKTKSVYTEKEILSLATKAGVNANTVADVNQGLVDDGLVDKEKIGGSNYFWSFPAKKDRIVQIKHEQTLQSITSLQTKISASSAKLADAKRGREDEDGERSRKLARLAELDKERKAAQSELEKLKENDPRAIADLEKELKFVTEAANRWTDNIFQCKSYLTKKRGLHSKEANRILQITDAFDYPE
uniref:Meiotic nuclear division protein 1 homolog n=1 Tax=Ditylum brightwellii TaxID=49249 RepID=A0A6S9AKJ2_9STRA|mmetsp:Transcript_19982/g.28981  ORF Transcript_19982/g.28981 Transcript_19982/m.28981 type:complete len:206 (-) Transcript_19982:261-878(-)